jgi:hypothetical protein
LAGAWNRSSSSSSHPPPFLPRRFLPPPPPPPPNLTPPGLPSSLALPVRPPLTSPPPPPAVPFPRRQAGWLIRGGIGSAPFHFRSILVASWTLDSSGQSWRAGQSVVGGRSSLLNAHAKVLPPSVFVRIRPLRLWRVLPVIELDRRCSSGGSAAARPRIPTTRSGRIARAMCPRASSRSRSIFLSLSPLPAPSSLGRVFYFVLCLLI